jgi:hypothetical protein
MNELDRILKDENENELICYFCSHVLSKNYLIFEDGANRPSRNVGNCQLNNAALVSQNSEGVNIFLNN